MPFYFFVWDDENEQHLAEHGVTPEEFQEVVCDPDSEADSRSTGKPIAFGETASGKYLAGVYEFIDDVTVDPITAYEVDE